MSSKFKKYLLSTLIICISVGTYWFFYANQWGVAISNEHTWKSSFQPKTLSSYNNIDWEKGTLVSDIPKKGTTTNLLFRTEFEIKDLTKILQGTLEYGFRYSAKILINEVEYTNVNRNLISSELEGNKIKVVEYWRHRKIIIDYEFLQRYLKNGKNTITIIIYNVGDLKSIENSKKQLSFLTKGQNNKLDYSFKLKKAKPYFSESKLPIFNLSTNNKTILDDPKIKASLNIINNSPKINTLTSASTFHNIKIERRGHTSQTFAKKSYSFNIYDASYQKTTVPLLDLPASRKWVLYGPYADKSLIRNALTYSIYTQMGNYAPRTQFVDLVINNNYQGIYMLTEKIQISNDHLNIEPLRINKTDSSIIGGGYIIEVDRNEWKSVYPREEDSSSYPASYTVYSPKKKALNSDAQELIKSQYTNFEKHLYENDSIYNYLDINTFIDYLIITELSKNVDGYCLSTFLYNKNINNKTPKFYIGPIWDYNFSFGLTDYREGFNPEGYVYNSTKFIPFWWNKLLEDKTFKAQLKSRYFELRRTTLSNQNINTTIDSLASICNTSNEINFKKWTVLNSNDFWPNYYLGKTYADEINYLKKWTKERLYFLDNDILAKENKSLEYYEISIRNNLEWMKDIKLKAKKRNISINEMVKIDAKHMAKKE